MTSNLDTGKAALLRKPFVQTAVGKLPRTTCGACSKSQRKRCDDHQWIPNCPECHGSHTSATIHLNYVGHAAVTDRLLEVDPEWNWEPVAIDQAGFPGRDREGNLWIRLTVCGVTRLGVGDGKSTKECIGDAIRNAAMRFGVAIDMWSKDELEQVSIGAERLRSAVAAELASRTPDGSNADAPNSADAAGEEQSPSPEPVPQTSGAEDATGGEAAPAAPVERPDSSVPESPYLNTSSKLARRMFALFGEIKLKEKADRLAYVADVIGREVASSTEMTDADAERVVAAIERDLAGQVKPEPGPVCPECQQGKHPNCEGQAWDTAADAPTDCRCPDASHGARS